MRRLLLIVIGLGIALAIESGFAQTQNRGIVGLNHVALSVPNLDDAVTYYTKTMGFPEAFRSKDDKGQTTLVYVQISRNTFVELQPANAQRPAGINHFGLVVQNMNNATALFKQRGANIGDIRVSPTKVILNNIMDPDGVRIELAELVPESEHYKAMERWTPNQTPNRGIVGLNHVAISVPNLEEAVTYYTRTMGFSEAFRNKDDKGQTTFVYIQISRDTFIELQPSNPQRPVGINHFGLLVQDMNGATAMFKQRSANVGAIRTGTTILSNITDPNGIRIELAELMPESPIRKAMEQWK